MEKLIQVLQDFSIQDPTSDSYEQRIIRDNDFEVVASKIEVVVLESVLELDCHPEFIKDAIRDKIKDISEPEFSSEPSPEFQKAIDKLTQDKKNVK